MTASGQRAVAAGGDIGQAVTGDGALGIQVEHAVLLPKEAFTPSASVVCPPGVTNLPEIPGLFVGRQWELNLLDRALGHVGGVVVHAVHGLGGIGKSTLAAHWAWSRMADHNPVWWISADTPAALDAGLAALATALQPALAQALSQEALRERSLQWLSTHEGWLLVLDNVTDAAHVKPVLARGGGGRFLITSRRATGWHGSATPLALNVLDHAEAVELFTGIFAYDQPRDLDGVDEVCTTLGCLPLAVEQAAAFCAETGTSPRGYLELLEHYPADVYASVAEGGDVARTIARIWHLSLDCMVDDPLAGQILRILAWYAADAIPRSLLTPLAPAPTLLRALGRLAAHSMITIHSDTADLSVHRLVQAVARTPEPADPHRRPEDIADARIRATIALAEALPTDTAGDPASWPAWEILLPHVDALIDRTPPGAESTDLVRILSQTGQFLLRKGSISRATARIQRAVEMFEQAADGDRHSALAARNNLAQAYQLAGNTRKAIPLCEQLLADSARELGEDHPDTLTAQHNLAHAYLLAGNSRRAISICERTLADRIRISGEDHPETIIARGNLAAAYREAGEPRRAIPLLECALTGALRVLGKEHLNTLSIRNALAAAHHAAGNVWQAIPLYEEGLETSVRVLGDDHPDTLTAQNNLAYAYAAAGDVQRSISLYEQTLTDSIRVSGEDHPSTLTTRTNLATAYQLAGDLERAIRMHRRTLEGYARALSEDHPAALNARSNLAVAYRLAGDPEQAVPLCERTLADSIRVLGEDHPEQSHCVTILLPPTDWRAT